MRRDGAIASVDAHTCYDRIVHSVASLCFQRMGVPVNAVKTMFETTHNMRFYLRTAYGDSTASYGGTEDDPFQGVCQGNGGGPATWLAISAVLVNMMHSEGLTATIKAALTGVTYTLIGLIFVDDTDLFCMAECPGDDVEFVVHSIQEAMTAWHGGLRFTGGTLRPDKCKWSLISFLWDNGKLRYAAEDDVPAKTRTPGLTGNLTDIERVPPDVAIEVLGFWQAADGNMKKQKTALIEKVKAWGEAMKSTWCPRPAAWLALRSIMWSSIKYVLGNTTFTAKEGDEVIRPLYFLTINSLGAAKNFPIEFRICPKTFLGLEMPHPYTEQGISKVDMIMQHAPHTRFKNGTLVGSAVEASLELLQLEAGCTGPVLESDLAHFDKMITPSWLKTLWEFLYKHEGVVLKRERDMDDWVPGIKRVNDKMIMPLMKEMGFGEKECVKLNRVRMAKEVSSLADLVTGDGRSLRQFALDWGCDVDQRSKYVWPTEQPSNSDYDLWTKAIEKIANRYGSLPLERRLGPWTARPHQQWRWFCSPDTRHAYKRQEDGWDMCHQSPGATTRGRIRHTKFNETDELPDDWQYTTVEI